MLGRYDISLKCVEIRRLLDNRNYKKALSILETLDTDKVKNITDLNAFADVYRKTEQYDLAEEMLLRVYEKSPTYRVIYKLVIVSLRKGNLSAAEDYYKDYIEVAPETAEKYILEYRVKKAKHSDYKDRIQTLEELKKIDYMEEWAYELAKLYHKAGMSDKCIAECDDIVLWFSEGIIVEKAKMLRAYYIDGADILSRTRQRTKFVSQPAKEIKSSKDMILDTMDLSAQISELKDNEYKMEVAQQLAGDLEPTVDVGKVMQQELVKESNPNEKLDLYDIQERREKRKNGFFRNKKQQIEENNPVYAQEYKEENLEQEQLFWAAEELAATQEAYQMDMEPYIEEQLVDMQTDLEKEQFISTPSQLEEQYMQESIDIEQSQHMQIELEEQSLIQIPVDIEEEKYISTQTPVGTEEEEQVLIQVPMDTEEENQILIQTPIGTEEEGQILIQESMDTEEENQILMQTPADAEEENQILMQTPADIEEERYISTQIELEEQSVIRMPTDLQERQHVQEPMNLEERSAEIVINSEEYSEQITTDLEKEQFIQKPLDWQEEFEEESELSGDELRLQAELNEELRKKMTIQTELNVENLQEEFTESKQSNWNQQIYEQEIGVQSGIYQEDEEEKFTASTESNWNQQTTEEEVERISEVNKEVLQEPILEKQEIDVETIRKTYSQRISVKLNSAQQQAVLQSKMKAKVLQEPEIKVDDTNISNSLQEKVNIQNQEIKEKILEDNFIDKDMYSEQIEQEETEKNAPGFLVGKIDVSIFLEQYAEDEIVSEQLYELLEQLENAKEHPHFLITANQAEDAIEFTKNLAKVLQKIEFMRSSRIAKIQAIKLNRMNLEDKQNKLMDSTLLIEKAGEMYRPTVTNILSLLKEMNDRLTVVLQGTYQEIEILLEENYDLREAFLYRIDL